jgi:hypothetical protein
MTQDFLQDFINVLKKENMQFVIAVIDKKSKDYHVSYDMFNEKSFDRLLEILHDIRERES